MKIATWNVNSIRTRLEQVVDWLGENPVDALCMQETKVMDDDFPIAPFSTMGYHVYISGQKSYNGVAIASRQKLIDVSADFTSILPNIDPEWNEQKRIITGVIDGIQVVNVYVPNGAGIENEKYIYKLRWLKILEEYLQTLLKKTSVICLCGDFNIALEDKDIHAGVSPENHIMASILEREALRDILALGFADAFRKFTSDGEHYSWWDYRAASFRRNLGWRIDHHYLTPELCERAKSCIIDVTPRKLSKPSDHTPVIVEF